MEKKPTPKMGGEYLSQDAFIGVGGIVVGIGAYLAAPGWGTRLFFLVVAVSLIIYAARHHSSHPVARALGAVIAIGLLVAYSWRPILEDFQKNDGVISARSLPQKSEPEPIKPTAPTKEIPGPPPPIESPPAKTPTNLFECKFVPVSPDYIMNLYIEHTRTSADDYFAVYKNKCIKVSGPIKGLRVVGDIGASLAFTDKVTYRTTFLYFEREWLDRMVVLPPETILSFQCRIKNASQVTIELEQCEAPELLSR
jgi:hypothetical protein